MHSPLIAAWYLDPSFWFIIAQVCIGLGFLIFVHELGHFLAAKACGVRVDKFYIGFQPWGLRICRFKWGETEYGIGALPLGGYVKMLGQEDNPARLREEMERAKLEAQNGKGREAATESQTTEETVIQTDEDTSAPAGSDAEPEVENDRLDPATVRAALYDPRSYLCKSVPQRMLIISAGVIMNLIFAFLLAIPAFWMGVPRVKPIVGTFEAGSPAWANGIMPGDVIQKLGGYKTRMYSDLRMRTTLPDSETLQVELVRRVPVAAVPPTTTGQSTGQPKREEVVIQKEIVPNRSGLAPRLGLAAPGTTTIHPGFSAIPGTAAYNASRPLQGGDRIVRIGDISIPEDGHFQLREYLIAHRDEDVTVLVQRDVEGGQEGQTEQLEITIPPEPFVRVGLILEMGEVMAVKRGSPADRAGLQPGDVIVAMNGQRDIDPIAFQHQTDSLDGDTVELTVSRRSKPAEGSQADASKDASAMGGSIIELPPVAVPTVLTFENPSQDGILSASSLGVAYKVNQNLVGVVPGSPADKAGIQAGDKITTMKFILPEVKAQDGTKKEKRTKKYDLGSEPELTSALVTEALQGSREGTQVELAYKRGDETKTATLTPEPVEGRYLPMRGLAFKADTFLQKGENVGQVISLAFEETVNDTLMVYRFLQHLLRGDISPKAVGGPITIFQVTKMQAERGLSELLIFLTMLSANLAVINFLPIPVFDGGHMVFLAYEGIRGKPASERVQEFLSFLGLIFILSLMMWVLALDFGIIAR